MANSIVFKIMNQEMMDALVKRGDVRLPKKKVSIPKDKRWNTKKMNAKLIKGLENGDSIRKIMKSLEDVIGDNRASQERNARTMVTEAENHGRFDSYKKLEQDGVVMKKEWIATPDDRTRASHVDLDGEEQDIDKPFSNGCMYPADGDGPPEEVWNCRCSMGSHIIGFKRSDGTVSKVNYEQDKTTHEKQMEEEREKRVGMVAKSRVSVQKSKIQVPDIVREDLQEYVDGTGENFMAFAEKETIEFVKNNMEISDNTFYRVEQGRFTANKVEIGDKFSFLDDIRSFSNNENSMYEILEQSEEIDPNHAYVIFETKDEVWHFPVDKYIDHNEFENQHESLLSGQFVVLDKYYDDDETLRIVIKQLKK